VWRHRTTTEQKTKGWEMAVGIQKILYTVLDEAYKRQVEQTTETYPRGQRSFTKAS
jgi:hypothetical protein